MTIIYDFQVAEIVESIWERYSKNKNTEYMKIFYEYCSTYIEFGNSRSKRSFKRINGDPFSHPPFPIMQLKCGVYKSKKKLIDTIFKKAYKFSIRSVW